MSIPNNSRLAWQALPVGTPVVASRTRSKLLRRYAL